MQTAEKDGSKAEQAENTAKKGAPRLRYTFTAPLLALCMMLLYAGSKYIDDDVLGWGDTLYLSAIILRLFIFMLPCIFYAKISGEGYSEKLKLRPFPPSRLGFMLLVFAALVSGSVTVKLALSYMGVAATEYAGWESLVTITSATGFSDIIYMITAFALVPAVTEEFAFRAILFAEYSNGGQTAAVLFSTFLYAISFLDVSRLPLYIFFGLVYSLTLYVTRSFFAPLLLHAAYATLNIFAESYILRLVSQSEYRVIAAFISITLTLLFFALTFGEAERLFHNDALTRYYSDEDSARDAALPREFGDKLKFFAAGVLSPPFLACAAVFTAAVFLM